MCKNRWPTLCGKCANCTWREKKGVITQMGNQGHTFDDNRLLKEWLDAGVVGAIKEIHVWTNRPIWPQGADATFRPGEVPPNLDWELWLAATPDHRFSADIHPFKWRGSSSGELARSATWAATASIPSSMRSTWACRIRWRPTPWISPTSPGRAVRRSSFTTASTHGWVT